MITSILSKEGVFAGWPANHSLHQWDNEILVGYVAGDHHADERLTHNVLGQLYFLQSRSFDYGKTWSEPEPTQIPEKFRTTDLLEYKDDPKKDIFRIRGNYDHGGDYLDPSTGFYASSDKGKTWRGPFAFKGLTFDYETYENSSRTCVVNEVFYLTRKKARYWASDSVIPCILRDGVFEIQNTLILERPYRTAMPSVVSTPNGVFMAVRTKKFPTRFHNGIEIFKLQDNSWVSIRHTFTGNNNGNPPSLFYKNGELHLFYGNRKKRKILHEKTSDFNTWTSSVIYEAASDDFGYCQSFDAAEKGIGIIFYEDKPEHKRSEINCIFV